MAGAQKKAGPGSALSQHEVLSFLRGGRRDEVPAQPEEGLARSFLSHFLLVSERTGDDIRLRSPSFAKILTLFSSDAVGQSEVTPGGRAPWRATYLLLHLPWAHLCCFQWARGMLEGRKREKLILHLPQYSREGPQCPSPCVIQGIAQRAEPKPAPGSGFII